MKRSSNSQLREPGQITLADHAFVSQREIDRLHEQQKKICDTLEEKIGIGGRLENPESFHVNGECIGNYLASLEFRGCIELIKENGKMVLIYVGSSNLKN